MGLSPLIQTAGTLPPDLQGWIQKGWSLLEAPPKASRLFGGPNCLVPKRVVLDGG